MSEIPGDATTGTRTPRYVDATFYAQLAPVWGDYYQRTRNLDHPNALQGAKMVRHTVTKPQRPAPGTVLVKLTVRVPAAAFYPLRPEAVVVIPEDMTLTTPIEIVASDPGGEDS